MGVYTKTGDKGMTGLYTGERVEKNTLRVETYGTVDEMNAALGMARAFCQNESVKEEIYKVQKLNALLMADLASIGTEAYIGREHIASVEQTIDAIEEKLPAIKAFIIPGSTHGGAILDLARTVVRRAERNAITLAKQENVSDEVLILLNRLSDLCFVLMRMEELD